jgi:hypothetical protein
MSHKIYRTENNCLNCGELVDKKFCPECGQENLDLRDNFFHLAGHAIGDFFHYDSKFFRSAIPLFTKPGFLTKEYWAGKRARYLHPLRMFFFVTIVFMISATYFYNRFNTRIKDQVVRVNAADTTRMDSTMSAEEKIKKLADQRVEEEKAKTKLYQGMDSFFKNLKYISFFLLPVYALIFKILYRRQKHLYVDHLVFTLHIQSFAYILIGMVLLIPFAFPEWLGALRRLTLLVILIYMVLALRRLYMQGWFKTILKSIIATISMVFITATVMGIFMLVYVFMD